MATLPLPPPGRFLRSQGVFYTRVGRGGRHIICKWPKRRRGPLSQRTVEQVLSWDTALDCIKHATTQQFNAANQLAGRSGLYRRDQLIAAAYGHAVSYPTLGVMPNGPAGPFRRVNKWGNPTYPLRAIGDPQRTNAMHKFFQEATDEHVIFEITTCHETLPVLVKSCCKPDMVPFYTRKGKQRLPHGNKLYFPCVPTIYETTTPYGKNHRWIIPPDVFDPPCKNCQITFGELGTDGKFEWQTLPMGCPTVPHAEGTADVGMFGFGAPNLGWRNSIDHWPNPTLGNVHVTGAISTDGSHEINFGEAKFKATVTCHWRKTGGSKVWTIQNAILDYFTGQLYGITPPISLKNPGDEDLRTVTVPLTNLSPFGSVLCGAIFVTREDFDAGVSFDRLSQNGFTVKVFL